MLKEIDIHIGTLIARKTISFGVALGYQTCLGQWKQIVQVLLIDTAYKIIRFNLLLFEITSVRSYNTNCCCGIDRAAREDNDSKRQY